MRIAFAGNPNSGKTTMYNALTGKNERVGNWAGVTIGQKGKSYQSGTMPIQRKNSWQLTCRVRIPCHHSHRKKVSPADTSETRHPDAIINIVDATNLSQKPVLHDTASGTGDPGSGGTQQE